LSSAAAIIEALNARAAATSRMREAARVSWRLWMDRLVARPGRVTGAPAQAVVDVLAARPLARPPARSDVLGRWQAFATLWRQQWHPASRDERGWRWTAGGVSFVWHVVVMALFLWITALRILPPPEPDAAVQVEYIGVGTPREQGGGEPPAPGEAAESSRRSPSQAPAAAPSAAAVGRQAPTVATVPPPDIVAPVSDVAAREVPEPRPAPQPLAVSPPVTADPPVFELPPTTPPEPAVATPDLARVPPLREVEIPEPVRAPEVRMPAPRIAVDPVRAPVPAVAEREVPAPLQLPAPASPVTRVDAPPVRATVPDVARRDVPAPRASAQSSATAAATPSDSSSRTPAASSAAATGSRAGEATQASGPRAASPRPGLGTGPSTTPAPGSWATPRRADDWGESDRNRPGRGDGIRDAEGRPRLGAAPGSAAPGRPPGMVTEEIADLDRAGTWLKRKAYPYEPTRFDRFWRPNETLLQEWVRRGIKQIAIPIPGSSKRIVCAVSILQLGGGCWPEDPNVNEQPATARPPPDIPFKPELQEGPGVTVPPAPASAPSG
jgi:hypothetical protein